MRTSIADRFKSFRMKKHATTGNVVDRIENLESSGHDRFNSFTRAQRLETISQSTGTLIADALISPADGVNEIEPTSSAFTGVAMGGEGWTFNSVVWHFVAVAAGVLQAGFNAAGKFLAGAGAVTLDADGITMLATGSYSDNNAYKISDGTNYILKIQAITGTGAQDSQILFPSVSGKSNNASFFMEHTSAKNNAIAFYISSGVGILMEDNASAGGARDIVINYDSADADTIIKGDTADIATFDAGLNALGVGGAAESGYIAKFTGNVKTTGDVVLGDAAADTLTVNASVAGSTWTPVIKGDGTAGAGTYTTQSGIYKKMGNIVFFKANLVWTAHTGTGNMYIDGLPFTSANDSTFTPCTVTWASVVLAAVGNKILAWVPANSTQIALREMASGARALLPIDTAASMEVSGFYFT